MLSKKSHWRGSKQSTLTILIGAAAGIGSGLLGVGGGIIMVPLLTAWLGFSQHRAHATSLAAILPIASVGALQFGMAGTIDYALVLLLALGAAIGAPIGAAIMARSREGMLKTSFGILMILVSVELLWL